MSLIPYEELLMEPNRTPAERLGAIVGRRFVFSRDQWPAWQRLVDRFSWAAVIRAADACEPSKRFPNNVEALCLKLADEAKQEAREAEQRAREASRPKVADRKGMGEMFRQIRERVMGVDVYRLPGSVKMESRGDDT